MRAEISYDLVMEDDMEFVEGTYCLPGSEWEVFIFTQLLSVRRPEVRRSVWQSGASGIVALFPKPTSFDKDVVKQVLSKSLSVQGWVEVRGPDSINLR